MAKTGIARLLNGALVCLYVSNGVANDNPLLSMDLESLMDLHVTTVTKRTQNLQQAASAIYVIRQEDIRRSGATLLPEVLALAPGIDVSRINSHLWGVTARGLKGLFSNKLLVMVDGRSVYSPYFAGVYWDSLLPPLNDIERIEIIRGPGAGVWGSNAVNGVINILTYDSEMTAASRMSVGAGNEERGFLRARDGFKRGELTGRVSVEYRRADEAYDPLNDSGARDKFRSEQISSRFDWRPTVGDIATLDTGITRTHQHVQYYLDEALQPFFTPNTSLGSKASWVQGSWLHALTEQDSLLVKAYLDHDDRTDAAYHYIRTTTDIDVQINGAERNAHTLTAGINYRQTADKIDGSYLVSFAKDADTYSRYTAFVQDEIALDEKWLVTIGTKFENSDFTSLEYQPSLRVAWLMSETLTLWSSLSHAVRTSSPVERVVTWRHGTNDSVDQFVETNNLGSPDRFFSEINGNTEFSSEKSDSMEIGVRSFLRKHVYIDVAAYAVRYNDLQGFGLQSFRTDFPVAGYNSSVLKMNNESDGRSQGVEIAAQFDVSDRWSVKSAYSYSHFDTESSLAFAPDYYYLLQRATPLNTFYLLSRHDIGATWELDVKLDYESEARYISSVSYVTDEFTDLSLRLAYSVTPEWQISLVGKQLLDPSRVEMVAAELGPIPTAAQRSVFLQVDWAAR